MNIFKIKNICAQKMRRIVKYMGTTCPLNRTCHEKDCNFCHVGGNSRIGLQPCKYGAACSLFECEHYHTNGFARPGLQTCEHDNICSSFMCNYYHTNGFGRCGLLVLFNMIFPDK